MRRHRNRRAPGWVRELSSQQLHQIAGRFLGDSVQMDLTDRQEWLWTVVIGELEWRWWNEPDPWSRCHCQVCIPPFPEEGSTT